MGTQQSYQQEIRLQRFSSQHYCVAT